MRFCLKSFFSDFFCKEEKSRLEDLGLELSNLRVDIYKKQAELEETKAKLEEALNNYNSCTSNLDKTKEGMQKTIDELTNKCAQLQTDISVKANQIQELMQKQDVGLKLLPPITQQLLTEYTARYARADIEYSGRYLGTTSKRYSMDVRAFCSEGWNDKKIVSKLKDCYVKDIMRLRGVDFHRACDIAVMNVSNVFSCSYAYDSTTWGTPEFWMFASETAAFGKGDCEDMAILRYVACRVAGIPHQMLRVGVGTTFSDQGHATNFYFASDLKWHHINSTSNYSKSQDVLDLPVTKDKNDKLNIRDVWFSFNEDMTWYDLITAAQKKAMNKKPMKKLEKYFKITPIFGER